MRTCNLCEGHDLIRQTPLNPAESLYISALERSHPEPISDQVRACMRTLPEQMVSFVALSKCTQKSAKQLCSSTRLCIPFKATGGKAGHAPLAERRRRNR